MLEIKKIRPGDKLTIKGDPYEVLKTVFSKIGRQGAVLRTRLKNLKNGAVSNSTFRDSDKLEEADISRSKAQFLYKEEGACCFMDKKTFDQFSLSDEALGNQVYFLKEGGEVEVVYYQGKPINLDLPIKLILKVTEAPPEIKGNTADGGSKKIKLETGYELNAPLFIKEGDLIKVNTREGNYVERAS
jgi:elongation factor P